MIYDKRDTNEYYSLLLLDINKSSRKNNKKKQELGNKSQDYYLETKQDNWRKGEKKS